jgi:hypothetical protein
LGLLLSKAPEIFFVVRTAGLVLDPTQMDNGPEIISKEVDLWAYAHGVVLYFPRPGKPTDNAFIAPFNSRFRQECLNEHWFLSLEDAKEKIEAWRGQYKMVRRTHPTPKRCRIVAHGPAAYSKTMKSMDNEAGGQCPPDILPCPLATFSSNKGGPKGAAGFRRDIAIVRLNPGS